MNVIRLQEDKISEKSFMVNAIVQRLCSFHGFRSIPKTENQKLTLGVVKTAFSKR